MKGDVHRLRFGFWARATWVTRDAFGINENIPSQGTLYGLECLAQLYTAERVFCRKGNFRKATDKTVTSADNHPALEVHARWLT